MPSYVYTYCEQLSFILNQSSKLLRIPSHLLHLYEEKRLEEVGDDAVDEQ